MPLLNSLAQNICVPALLQLCVLCPCIAFTICQPRVKLQIELNLLNLCGAPLFDQPIVGSSDSTYTFLSNAQKQHALLNVQSCFQGHQICITVGIQFLTRAVDMLCMLLQTGATLYACRFPERMFPGKFDLAFSSHQLFHVCVVVAAAIHYKAIFQLLAWRDATGGAGGCLKGSCQTVLPPMHMTTG